MIHLTYDTAETYKPGGRGQQEAFCNVNSNKAILTLRFCLSALSPEGHYTIWVCLHWTGFLWHDSHSILILAVGNLSSRKWGGREQPSLVTSYCSESAKATRLPRANWAEAGAAPGQFSATLPGLTFDGCLPPSVSLWRWPALSLSYLSLGFFLGRSWQWCHHLVMLLSDLVHWIGSTRYSWTLKLNRGKNLTKNQGEEALRLCKGVAPWAPSPDFQTLMREKLLSDPVSRSPQTGRVIKEKQCKKRTTRLFSF